jgi:L-malate glycosyltransferase
MCPTNAAAPATRCDGPAERAGRPLKVLYCIDTMARGGTEKQLAAVIQHLDPKAVQPHLCTLRPSETDVRELGCEAIELPFTSFGSPTTIGHVRWLRRFIREQGIDLVHAFFQDSTVMAYLATAGTNVVRVGSFRDMGFWRTPGKVLQLRLVYPRYHGFIANSHMVARHVHEQDHVPLEKIHVIYNGVRVPESARRRDSPLHPTVGIVANLNRPVKRVDLFLRVARLVADAIPDARFVIVGDGHLRPALVELCSALELTDVVSFRGSVADPSVEIGQFSVGVLTSDSEGLSNAILEYMAAGVPTVARRTGGNAEAVRHEETGLLVDEDTPHGVANAIVRLLMNQELRLNFGARASAIAHDEFSFDACTARHGDYYHSAVEEQCRRLRSSRE